MDGISGKQLEALRLATKEGMVYAGYNISQGSRRRVSTFTLAACVRRGWLTKHDYRNDIGDISFFWRITDAGRSLPCLGDGR